jgi:hypothetical protein
MLFPIADLFEAGKDPADKVSATMRHCMLRVNDKGKDAKQSWNICRSSLTKHGYLKGPYDRKASLDAATKQTQKGSRRSMKHGMEREAPAKSAKFKGLFRTIEPGLTSKVTK